MPRDLSRSDRLRRCALALCAAVAADSINAERLAYFPIDAARGQQLAVVCLTCHGVAEMPSGTEPSFRVPRLAGQRGEAILGALLDYRDGARGSPIMAPLVASLSIQDMRDLAAFLSASGPYVPETADQGSWAHEKVRRDCTACHGESGMGVMAGVPVLTGQHEDYLVHALESYRDGRRSDPTMGPIARALAPDEIARLAAYFAKQSHLRANDPALLSADPVVAQGGAGQDNAGQDGAGQDAEQPSARQPSARQPSARQPSALRGGGPEATARERARSIVDALALIDVPSGEFVMGTEPSAGFQNGSPPHVVRVRAFRLAATEVTFDQYDAFARATDRELPPDEQWGRGARPVIHVDWNDVHAFIDWLNAQTGRRFRLPSEAEWEYAARAGSARLYPWGDRIDHGAVNNSVDDGTDRWTFTAPVAQFPANAFGLHDMLGNVWEFVQDCRYATYEDAPSDGSPRLGGSCDSRIVRGGSWGSTSRGVQPAARGAASEHFASMDLGFRLAEDR